MKKQKWTMKKFLSILALTAMLFTTTGTYLINAPKVMAATEETKTDSEKFDEFTNELFKEAISNDILTNNMNVIDSSKYGVKDVPNKFPAFSSSLEDQINANQEVLQFLHSVNYSQLTKEQQDLYDLLKFETKTPEETTKFQYYKKAFSAYSGVQVSLISILTGYNFDEREDFVNYLEVLKDVPNYLADAVKYEQKRSELGIFISDRELDEVLTSIKALIADPENMVLITTFNHTVDQFDLNNRDRLTFKADNKEIIFNTVIPAFEQTMKDLDALRGTGIGDDEGLTALPYGKEYYRQQLRYYTGSTRTPEEYFTLFDQLSDACLKELMQISAIANEKNWKLPSAQYVLGKPENYLNLLMKNCEKDYSTLENVTFHVKTIDEALGMFAAPAYILPPQIDSKGPFNVNINPAYASSATFPTVSHEGYPGHLYQFITLNQSGKNPLFNLVNNYGYIEGWANYVESRAYYYTDCSELYARYKELLQNNNNYRIYKLDLLVNYFGYTKKQAVNYMLGMGLTKEAAEFYYYHFITVPAYNMCYIGGQAELELLLSKAQNELGKKFSRKAFHDFYLSEACCTFDTLDKRMDEWIAEQ